jgi:hypothetical protein
MAMYKARLFNRIMALALCAATVFGGICIPTDSGAVAAETQEQISAYTDQGDGFGLTAAEEQEAFSTHEAPFNAEHDDDLEDVGLGRVYDPAKGIGDDEMLIGEHIYPLAVPIVTAPALESSAARGDAQLDIPARIDYISGNSDVFGGFDTSISDYSVNVTASAGDPINIVSSTLTSITVQLTFPAASTGRQLHIYYPTGWAQYSGNSSTMASGNYTVSGLAHSTQYGFFVYYTVNGTLMSYGTINGWTTAQGPTTASLTASSITSTSFNLNVQFPTGKYVSNAQLQVLNPYPYKWTMLTLNASPNGTYARTGLVTGYTYAFIIYWRERDTGDTSHSLMLEVTTTLPAQTTVYTDSTYFTFGLETYDVNLFASGKYAAWRTKMDTAYANMLNLTGEAPYNGEKITIQSTRDPMPGVWAYAGNPIRWSKSGVTSQILAINADDDWSYGILHEIGHDFDSARWNFDAEFFANLKVTYVVDTNPAARVWTALIDSVPYINSSNLLAFYKTYAPGSYDKTVALGTYDNDGLNYTFLKIKNQIGWEPFRQTFRYFNSLSTAAVPSTNLGKLNLFLSKLKDYSGTDIFVLLTVQERNVYQAKFGGTIAYTDSKTSLVLLPGLMGSRLYYNGERKWEPDASDLLNPIDSDWFWLHMKPYLMSNENGVPNYTLDATRASGDYGALDAYEDIYNYLDNASNFPKSEYRVKFFTYDWRLSSAANADSLANYLANDNNVVLIAHSMGGLVASAYLAKGVAFRNKVQKLITFGTPYLGAAKAICGFETGELMSSGINLFIATHLKEICENTTSAYELLPTSRYGTRYVSYNSNDLTWSEARTFLQDRYWARKAIDNTVKPMFASSNTFHNSLMINYTHIANSFGAYYIIGTGRYTQSKAVYEYDVINGFIYLSHFETANGDGTVLATSASNLTSNYRVSSFVHMELVKDILALDYMKDVIKGTSTQSQTTNTSIAEAQINTWETRGDNISVVLQGVQNLVIFDSDGNELIQEGDEIYRENLDGSKTRVGCIWLIDNERQRYQYVLEPGEYQFEDIELDPSIQAEALFMSFEAGLYTSKTEFTDFSAVDDLRLEVSSENCLLANRVTSEEIAPSKTATIQELLGLNEDK